MDTTQRKTAIACIARGAPFSFPDLGLSVGWLPAFDHASYAAIRAGLLIAVPSGSFLKALWKLDLAPGIPAEGSWAQARAEAIVALLEVAFASDLLPPPPS